MSEKDDETLAGEIFDETGEITLLQLCRSCAVGAETIEALIEQGIIEPVGRRAGHWCFPAVSMRQTRITLQLQRDLGVNLEGAALALELMEQIDELRARLAALRRAQ